MKDLRRKGRVAFLLNTNAKSVTLEKRSQLAKLIPQEDLYFSRSLNEAEEIITKILSLGYPYIFSGGGDGTAIGTINLLSKIAKTMPEHSIPRIGVLRLGTGNALARMLGARSPEEDIKAILSGRTLRPLMVNMVETVDGMLAPFAGIGYDGELMNDFLAVKKLFARSPFKNFFSNIMGFTIAGVFKTLPRQIGRTLPIVHIASSMPAYRIVNIKGKDEEIFLPKGTELYSGRSPLICVGTIPLLGYGIKMFPFANKRPGYMHLRISAVPLTLCMANLFPAVWNGTFRHPKLYDFLVKDVSIDSNEDLPYQFAGDAMGYKKQLHFNISSKPVGMASLYKVPKKLGIPGEPLLLPWS